MTLPDGTYRSIAHDSVVFQRNTSWIVVRINKAKCRSIGTIRELFKMWQV